MHEFHVFLLLFKSEIAAALPKGDSSISGAGGDAVTQLRQYMEEVNQTKKSREDLEKEFKGATVDMQSKFLQALAAEGYLDGERLISHNLDELYSDLKTQVEEILQNQTELVEKIQVCINVHVYLVAGS